MDWKKCTHCGAREYDWHADTVAAALQKRPVAWRVKDYADGWIVFQNENDANTYASSVGALIQGLYSREG
jgi:hypothetical protein